MLLKYIVVKFLSNLFLVVIKSWNLMHLEYSIKGLSYIEG